MLAGRPRCGPSGLSRSAGSARFCRQPETRQYRFQCRLRPQAHAQAGIRAGVGDGEANKAYLLQQTRRQLSFTALTASIALLAPTSYVSAAQATIDTTITAQVYLDIGICSSALKSQEQRTLGSKSIIPDDAQLVGRLVLGLYGNHVPVTVRNMTTLVQAGALNGTTFSRVLPGEYIQAGKQGARRVGELQLGPDVVLEPNPELSSASAFQLPHLFPGSLSLSLSENDEEAGARERPNYRPIEFLITTGPGPVPRLDGQNIVFGRVVEGIDVVRAVAEVPTFQPSERTDAMNRLAAFIGDDRANNVRRKYGRPLRAVVIMGSGVLPAPASSAS